MHIKLKLGMLLLGITCIFPSTAQALLIDPAKIDSSQGEPFYAEIPFYHAQSKTPIQVSIVQPDDLGITTKVEQTKNIQFNFYVRQNNQGDGVIVITSTQAIKDHSINVLLKINDAGQIRIQQLKVKLPTRIQRLQANLKESPLQPRLIHNEKDIALNLPEAGNMSTPSELQISRSAPPALLNTPDAIKRAEQSTSMLSVASIPATAAKNEQNSTHLALNSTPQPITKPPTTSNELLKNQRTEEQIIEKNDTLTITITRRSEQPPATTAAPNRPITTMSSSKPPPQAQNQPKDDHAKSTHVVKRNDTLWKISAELSRKHNVAITDVMQQLQADNKDAFIAGNANLLKQGAILSIPRHFEAKSTEKQPIIKRQKQLFTQQKVMTLPNKQQPTGKTQPSTAHMSLVANSQGSVQGSHPSKIDTQQQNELTLQLKQKRNVTLGIQNDVHRLDQELKAKDKRIALLNAKLAEIEQQLKSQKTMTNTTSQSTSTAKLPVVIPALLTGTLFFSAELNTNFAILTLLQELV